MRDSKISKMTYCSLFTALICICSIIEITLFFSPVPITLQTFAVMVCGIVLGKKYGVISVILYLLLGAIGLPVFSGLESGFGVLLSPTGGFLLGFIPGVYITGLLYEKLTKTNVNHMIASGFSIFIGLVFIYAIGVIQFMIVVNVGVSEALAVAVLPFLPFEFIKVFIAVLTCAYMEKHNIAVHSV